MTLVHLAIEDTDCDDLADALDGTLSPRAISERKALAAYLRFQAAKARGERS